MSAYVIVQLNKYSCQTSRCRKRYINIQFMYRISEDEYEEFFLKIIFLQGH